MRVVGAVSFPVTTRPAGGAADRTPQRNPGTRISNVSQSVTSRFEITRDFVNQVAVLKDEFDVSPSGTLQLPLEEFLLRLGWSTPAPEYGFDAVSRILSAAAAQCHAPANDERLPSHYGACLHNRRLLPCCQSHLPVGTLTCGLSALQLAYDDSSGFDDAQSGQGSGQIVKCH